MFVMKADTPEAMRDEIVKWLNLMASNHRIAAAKLIGVHKREIELARATTYQGAADFLGYANIEGSAVTQDGRVAMIEECVKAFESSFSENGSVNTAIFAMRDLAPKGAA